MNGGAVIDQLGASACPSVLEGDLQYQKDALQAVSRTFALTIPQLPGALECVVGNAYLLCRIADTVEDAAELDSIDKQRFAMRFVDVVAGRAGAETFAEELAPRLVGPTPASERELVSNTPRVVTMTHSFNEVQREALLRCVRIMSQGMAEFQEDPSLGGLSDMAEMDRYCYHVAGVVGEMLTALFCEHCKQLRSDKDKMMELAVSFGQGLQMTNILKDIWEDRKRGACWLPGSLFGAHDVDLALVTEKSGNIGFGAGLNELIGIARGHLSNALDYTLMLPASEPGIRRFCLWALGMAVLTLRRIAQQPNFRSSDEVKISRRAVRATVAFSSLAVRNDRTLRWTFDRLARALPSPPDHYIRADVSRWLDA
ncbi:MAG: phytoene/squalene synthase family protein [Chromatiales bacterium]|jgi:farnesyl-diphosphate farnesyltransferase|nr:phytoene/squalene synthase family protein [Chromatiales bacterium]